METKPRRGPEGAALEPDDLDAVGMVPAQAVVPQPARGPREDLQRSHDVQHLDVGEGEHGDTQRAPPDRPEGAPPGTRFDRHARAAFHDTVSVGQKRLGDNDNVPTISAIEAGRGPRGRLAGEGEPRPARGSNVSAWSRPSETYG